MKNRHIAAGLALALAAGAAAAAETLPPTAADLTGVRAAAIGAYRGLAGGNDEIFLNAAALAARRRYSVETHWLLERHGGSNAGQFLSAAIVDSQMSDVAGGFAYTRVASGPSVGNAFHAAAATALARSVYAGITGKYLSLSGQENVRAATIDASLFVPLGRFLSVGAAGYNLVPVSHRMQAPRAAGAGIAIGNDRSYNVTADFRRDFDRLERRSDAYAVGGELLLARYFPVRAGWTKDETRDAQWWSAGAGFVTTAGAAMDVTYRQGIQRTSDRTFGVALKIFFLE